MAFFTKTTSDLNAAAEDRIRQETVLNQSTAGAKAKVLFQIANREVGAAYSAFNSNLLSSFLRNATGEQLDLIGELLNKDRFVEQQIEVNAFDKIAKIFVSPGTFGDYNSGNNITVPIGTRVYTNETQTDARDEVYFVTTQEIVLPKDTTEAFISIRAEQPGTASNIAAGTLKNINFSDYTTYNQGNLLQVTNSQSFIIARDRESDDNYRFRISQATLANQGANLAALRLAVLSIPGVAEVIIEKYKRGTGTANFYIQATTATVPDAVLFESQEAVNQEASGGASILIKKPINIGLELIFSMSFKDKTTDAEQTDIKSRVKRALTFYINSLPIGESLNIQTLLNVIFSTDSRIKNIGSLTKPFEQVYIYRDTRTQDNKISELFVGEEILARGNERIIIEPSIVAPITIL